MDDEMKSMERFGVYRRVPRSAAKGRQVSVLVGFTSEKSTGLVS